MRSARRGKRSVADLLYEQAHHRGRRLGREDRDEEGVQHLRLREEVADERVVHLRKKPPR